MDEGRRLAQMAEALASEFQGGPMKVRVVQWSTGTSLIVPKFAA